MHYTEIPTFIDGNPRIAHNKAVVNQTTVVIGNLNSPRTPGTATPRTCWSGLSIRRSFRWHQGAYRMFLSTVSARTVKSACTVSLDYRPTILG
jgi:hypothetical protein